MGKLDNKVALITGGNSGIGYSTAELFISEGADVIITGRNQEKLDHAVAGLGGNTQSILADASNLADIDKLASEVEKSGKKLDVLFVNAGIALFAPLDAVDEAFFDNQFNTNVKGLFFTVQKLLPFVNDGGSIILNASVAAAQGMENLTVYAATKAAVLSLTRTLSAELLGRKIRVNAVSPGPINTPIFGKTGMTEEQINEAASGILANVPMNRFGEPEEIAKGVLYLASDDSSYVIGHELIIDGGMITL